MADRRVTPQQKEAQTYDSRLLLVGNLWEGTSRTSGNPILTGEISLGVLGDPKPIVITSNTRPDRSAKAPTHLIFIRVSARRQNGQAGGADDGAPVTGNGDDTAEDDDLPFDRLARR